LDPDLSGLMDEAHARGLLPPDVADAYSEAKNRGLVAPQQTTPQQDYYNTLAQQLPEELAKPNDLLQPSLKQAAIGVPIAGGFVPQTPEDTKFQTEHPYVTAGARTAGAIAGMAPAIMAAPELFGIGAGGILGRSLMSGATNALIGGTDAAVRGQPVSPAALTSGAVGMVVPYGAQVGGYAAGQVGNKIEPPPAGPLTGLNSRALDWAASAAKADGLNDAQIAQKYQELGPQGFVSEYGHNLAGLTGALYRQPGQAGTDIESAFGQRSDEARNRIEGAVTDAFGPRVNIADLTMQREAERKAATSPLYQQFYSQRVTPTPELSAILDKPSVKSALPLAAKYAADEGKPFMNTEIGQDGYQWQYPTGQTWDYIKRTMDDKARSAGFGTNESRIYGNISREITSAIDNHPDPNVAGIWQQARQAHADPKKVQEATEMGQNLFKSSQRVDELPSVLNPMSDPEKQGFIQGTRDAATDVLDRTMRGDTNARNMFLAPVNQAKNNYIIGPEKTQNLVQSMEREHTFAESQQSTLGGSPTGERIPWNQQVSPQGNNWVTTLREHLLSGPITAALKPLGTMANEEQGQAYEIARNLLGSKMVQQGPQGMDFAKALANYAQTRPSETLNPSTRALITMLSQGTHTPAANYWQQRQGQ